MKTQILSFPGHTFSSIMSPSQKVIPESGDFCVKFQFRSEFYLFVGGKENQIWQCSGVISALRLGVTPGSAWKLYMVPGIYQGYAEVIESSLLSISPSPLFTHFYFQNNYWLSWARS